MNEDVFNASLRRFLKKVGITSQREIEKAVRDARARGIFVNTIYCGSPGAGEARLWSDVATLGGGRYAAIDQNRRVAIATPMDRDLENLSQRLNGTYVWFGEEAGPNPYGATGLEWQTPSPPPPHNFDVTPIVDTDPYTYTEETALGQPRD